MLSIVLITPLITALAVPPGLITTIKVFSKFGALEERSCHEIIWLQILKTLTEEKNTLEKRHPELIARRVKALDRNRHEKNTYRKITHWFEVIKDIQYYKIRLS